MGRPGSGRGRRARRGLRRRPRPSRLVGARTQAALGLGVVVVLGVSGTWAHWTDSVVVSGTTLTSGTIDLRIDDLDAVTTTTLSMSAMVPGNTSAQVVTLKNAGTAPLKYTVAGGLGGTDAAAYAAAGAAKVRLVVGGTRSGSGNAATCTGGTVLLASTALTATPATALVSSRQGPIAATGTVAMCVELTFDAAAPQSLAGTTATVTLTFTGTTDVS